MGLAKAISDEEAKTAMAFDLSIYKNTPDKLKEVTNSDKLSAAKAELEIKTEQEAKMKLMKRRLQLAEKATTQHADL